MLSGPNPVILGKIAHLRRSPAVVESAVARRRAMTEAGSTRARILVSGAGWHIADILCTCDAHDPASQERHRYTSAAFVLAGAFEYRGRSGNADLSTGSILFGSAGAGFSCRHGHGAGDRCLAVQFEPEVFDPIRSELAPTGKSSREIPVALPAHRSTIGLFAAAEAIAGQAALDDGFGEEAALVLAERAFGMAWQAPQRVIRHGRHDGARIADIVRWVEAYPAMEHRLSDLAARCGMSPFHFLRRFRDTTGMTPHAFVRHTRLRDAARLLLSTRLSVLDIALEAGFSDPSTFNGAFRQAFGFAPRAYRRRSLDGALRG